VTELVRAGEPSDLIGRLAAAFIETKRQRSTHTADAYRRDLTLWLGWCHTNQLHPLDAHAGHIQLWLTWLADRGEAGTTRGRRLGAVSAWYRWLIDHGHVPANPAALSRDARPTRAPRPAPALSDQQTAAMLAAADQQPHPRVAAIVWLLIYTGIRVGELLAANVGDLAEERGHRVLHVRGKGGKTRIVALVPPVAARLDAYLASREDHHVGVLVPRQTAGAGGGDRPLIAWDTGRRMARSNIRALLQRVARKADLPAGVADRFTPHTTRATYATAALDDGVPLRDVQYALGHSNPMTTEGYDRSRLTPERNPAYRLLARFTPREEG